MVAPSMRLFSSGKDALTMLVHTARCRDRSPYVL